MAFPPPPPPATEKDESPENNDGNMGITPFEKQLCEKTIKATREKCMVEIEKQTQELKVEKKQFWAGKGTVAELEFPNPPGNAGGSTYADAVVLNDSTSMSLAKRRRRA
ncbi:hypothetical protein OEA41_001485 [Lepraria neglecta]|uniref:Uncharacterized protein n=1 Tax=Lepraria neglecta TaxID=209136 RepID=A0AAE0DLJ7_9LECA|nr:hypothetical protein OEA41_001485 [Lepraria neglecta]